MDDDGKMAVLSNDLDSMVHRIEELPPHPNLTDALNAVHEAKAAVLAARSALHQAALQRRPKGFEGG